MSSKILLLECMIFAPRRSEYTQADRASWELGEILWASSGQFMEERFGQRFFLFRDWLLWGDQFYLIWNFIHLSVYMFL